MNVQRWGGALRRASLLLVLALSLQASVSGGTALADEPTDPVVTEQHAAAVDDADATLSAAMAGAASLPASVDTATNTVAVGIHQEVFPQDLTGLSRYELPTGRKITIVHWFAQWGAWNSAFNRAALDAIAARGSIPLITWEPWAAAGPDPAWSLKNAILSGRNDAYIASWARGLAAYGKPVLLRFAHEMNDTPAYPWVVGTNGNTAADYIAAWKHVRAIFRRYHTSNVKWVWNPNTIGAAPATWIEPIYRSLYPGDDQVDWVGLDIYNTGPQLDWGAPYWRSFSEVLAEPYAAVTAVAPSKPLILPEVGSTEFGGSKAQWISDMFATGPTRFPHLRALVWFDVDKEQPWNLDSSPAALQAWLAGSAGPTVRLGLPGL